MKYCLCFWNVYNVSCLESYFSEGTVGWRIDLFMGNYCGGSVMQYRDTKLRSWPQCKDTLQSWKLDRERSDSGLQIMTDISPNCLVPWKDQGVPQVNLVETIFQIKADDSSSISSGYRKLQKDSVGVKNLKTAYPFQYVLGMNIAGRILGKKILFICPLLILLLAPTEGRVPG